MQNRTLSPYLILLARSPAAAGPAAVRRCGRGAWRLRAAVRVYLLGDNARRAAGLRRGAFVPAADDGARPQRRRLGRAVCPPATPVGDGSAWAGQQQPGPPAGLRRLALPPGATGYARTDLTCQCTPVAGANECLRTRVSAPHACCRACPCPLSVRLAARFPRRFHRRRPSAVGRQLSYLAHSRRCRRCCSAWPNKAGTARPCSVASAHIILQRTDRQTDGTQPGRLMRAWRNK
jgi:hypothetical protein